ncbi:hypothetical protein [Streptosporangium sp. H16]
MRFPFRRPASLNTSFDETTGQVRGRACRAEAVMERVPTPWPNR